MLHTNSSVISLVYSKTLHYPLAPHMPFYWMSPPQIPWYSWLLAALVTVILNCTCFDTIQVWTVSKLKNPPSTCPNPSWQRAIYWVSPARDQRFHLGSPGQPGSWKQQVFLIVSFCIWCMALLLRIAGFLGRGAALPNGSSERDSKSLNREGHQKHKMMFLADSVKADKVCKCVSEHLVCQYAFGVCVYMLSVLKSLVSCPEIMPWRNVCIFMRFHECVFLQYKSPFT